MNKTTDKQKDTEWINGDDELFEYKFHYWLEAHGVKLGEFIEGNKTFNAIIDLNKLKLGITQLKALPPINRMDDTPIEHERRN